MNDRVHGISCRLSDKTGKEIGHIFLNIKSVFMQKKCTYIPIISGKYSSENCSTMCRSFSLKSEQILFSVFRLCLDLWEKSTVYYRKSFHEHLPRIMGRYFH